MVNGRNSEAARDRHLLAGHAPVLFLAALVFLGLSPRWRAALRQEPRARLPEGEGRPAVLRNCTVLCHNAERIVAKKRTRAGWQQVLALMKENGAKFSPRDEGVILDYLAQTLAGTEESSATAAGASGGAASQASPAAGASPAQPPAADAQLSELPEGPGRDVVQANCVGACHDLENILNRRRNRAEWDEVMLLMADYGAEIREEDEKVIVEYLVRHFSPEVPAGSGGAGAPAPAAE